LKIEKVATVNKKNENETERKNSLSGREQ